MVGTRLEISFRHSIIATHCKYKTQENHESDSKTEQGCEFRTPPPSSWLPQRDHTAQDPLANPSGSLRFYAINSKRSRISQRITRPDLGARFVSIGFGQHYRSHFGAFCRSFLLRQRPGRRRGIIESTFLRVLPIVVA